MTYEDALEECGGMIGGMATEFFFKRPDIRKWYDLEDFLQEAKMAVMSASRTYDPHHGVQLVAYARAAVRHALTRMVQRRHVSGDHVSWVEATARAEQIEQVYAARRRGEPDFRIAIEHKDELASLRGGVDELDWQCMFAAAQGIDEIRRVSGATNLKITSVHKRAERSRKRAAHVSRNNELRHGLERRIRGGESLAEVVFNPLSQSVVSRTQYRRAS